VVRLTDIKAILIRKGDDNSRTIRIYKFYDVTIIGNNYPGILLYDRVHDLINPFIEQTMSLGCAVNPITKFTGSIPCNGTYNNGQVYYFIYNVTNFYHFLYDTLPYLWTYLYLRETNGRLALLMEDSQYSFVTETLRLLGIQTSDVVYHKPGTQYRELYIGSSMTHDGYSNAPPRKEIFEMFDTLIKHAIAQTSLDKVLYDKPKRFYISRRTSSGLSCINNIGTNYTERRVLLNELELVKELEGYGIREVFMENLTISDKINLMQCAELVIGAIGGTIANCVFCPESTKVIALVSPDFLVKNERFKHILSRNDVYYYNDTQVAISDGEIPLYTRIKTINGNYGEITSYNNVTKLYKIKLAIDTVGWSNSDDAYECIFLTRDHFTCLDNGLNSPWIINNIDTLISIISEFVGIKYQTL